MNELGRSRKVLVVSVAPYRFATRAKKAAYSYSQFADIHYLCLAAAGRSGRWDVPGKSFVDGIRVDQVRVRSIHVEPTALTQLRNMVLSYGPAVTELTRRALSIQADIIHVVDPTLSFIGLLHQLRFRSQFVLDLPERPGQIFASGSLASRFSRVEPLLLRIASRRALLATVVVPSDIRAVTDLGFKKVLLVRNMPLANWRAPYIEPLPRQKGHLRIVLIGTIFEGRGYEMILSAIAACKSDGLTVTLKLYGPGRSAYIGGLRQLADRLGIDDRVHWLGNIQPTEVSKTYLESDIGLVLYENSDPGNDGLSNKILECVASGRPVLAGDLPENRRFVSQNRVGWLSDMTETALADSLTQVARTSSLNALSKHCRDLGDLELIWENEFDAVIDAVLPRQWDGWSTAT